MPTSSLRSYTAAGLIQLPRLSAAEAIVLLTMIVTAAQTQEAQLAGGLPPAIGRSRGRLVAALSALEDVMRPRRLEVDPKKKRKADQVIDNAWSAFFDWLLGWCKLPVEKNPDRDRCKDLFDLVFPEASLEFLKLPYKIEWQESKNRLATIDQVYEALLTKLGGAVFLTHIREAQFGYGQALGITELEGEAPALPALRPPLEAALNALRDYATRVTAYADPDVPGSDELSAALLKPLTEWVSRPTTSQPEKAEEEGGKEEADAQGKEAGDGKAGDGKAGSGT